MTMKKILLLASAVAVLSPVAAKANQKSSVYVGIAGTLERLFSQGGSAVASDYLKDENFFAIGIEGGFGYKVWNNLQLAGFLRAQYSPEHDFAKEKNQTKGTAGAVIEPRVTLGWEIPVSGNFTITPFIGAGFEMNFAKKDGKEYGMDWKVPAVLGARFGFGYVYASVNGRLDLTSQEINKKDEALGRAEADTAKFFGVDVSVGAEF